MADRVSLVPGEIDVHKGVCATGHREIMHEARPSQDRLVRRA